MTKETMQILRRCRELLLRHYGVQLEQVVVYGSTAQDTANAQSDIDLLVVLQGPFEHAKELRRIVDLLYPVQLETERVISAKVPSPTIPMLCRAVVFGFEEGFSFAREAVDCLARRVERAQP